MHTSVQGTGGSDKKQWPLVWSWDRENPNLPRFQIFTGVEFTFKVVQWAAFSAALSAAVIRYNNEKLGWTANILLTLLLFVVGERVGRFLFGHIRPREGNYRPTVFISLVFLILASMVTTAAFNLLLRDVVKLLIEVYDQANKQH